MSSESDSDSDICDFTSSIGKQISKGVNQFWEDFNKRTQTENNSTNKDDDILIPNDATVTPNFNVSSSSTSNQFSTKEEIEVKRENVIQIIDNSVPNRITNKLNELSAEIQTILNDKRKIAKKSAKRTPVRRWQLRNSSRRKINRMLPHYDTIAPNVTLISDDELTPSMNLNLIKEELNPIVTIDVLWKSVEKNSFKVHKYQTLNCISEHYCEKFNINPKLLFFTLDDKYIKLEENSFISLRLSEHKQIEGGILPESYLNNSSEVTNPICIEPLSFKIQHCSRKHKEINVTCRTDDKMEIIFWKVSKSVQQPVENIKLYFDGSAIKPSMKICEMDIEEGDCFDLEILN